MAVLLLSGQHATMNVTALTSTGTFKSDEQDPASAFSFTSTVGDTTYTWPLSIGNWESGNNIFNIAAPMVTSKTTLTLNSYYKDESLLTSPPVIQFDVLPPYRGNFNLTGAVLAWDGTIYNPGTDNTVFDYSMNNHTGTNGDGV